MRWFIIRTIWFREVRDQLRDRRTVFMLVVLPVLLYPLLGIGMTRFTMGFAEQLITVGVSGSELLDEAPPLPKEYPEAVAAATIPLTVPGVPLPLALPLTQLACLPALEGAEEPYHLERLPPLLEPHPRGGHRFILELFRDSQERSLLKVRLGSREQIAELLARGDVQLAIHFTPDFVRTLRSGRRAALDIELYKGTKVASRPSRTAVAREPEPQIATDEDKSQLAYSRVIIILREWDRAIVKARMESLARPALVERAGTLLGLGAGDANVRPAVVSAWVAACGGSRGPEYHRALRVPSLRESRAERLNARVLPFLIVMMALTGALYPAIDLCAGEKERGTMETLLISPASRSEIVWGKFLTVWLFSTMTGLLNLACMAVTFSYIIESTYASPVLSGAQEAPVASLGLAGFLWSGVILLPLAALFSATCVALAAYARSTKEGQYYLLPLMLVAMPLILISLAPGAKLSPLYSMLPITGATLLLQALIIGGLTDQLLLYLGIVLLPMIAYCYLALYWAIQQFNREEVLFREAERLDLKLWAKQLFRAKEPLPSAGMAVACFLFLLIVGWVMQTSGGAVSPYARIATHQLAFVAAPALLMALLLTSQPANTLRLGSAPPLWALGAAVVLALALHAPIANATVTIINRFPEAKELLENLAAGLVQPQVSLTTLLLVMAVLPAVCEELAFRGFILSGLGRRLGPGKAILTSSLFFAFYHLNAFQLLPTFALGLVLGFLAVRSGSLVPGMVLHALHNAIVVLIMYPDPEWTETKTAILERLMDGEMYDWPLVVGSLAVAAGVLGLVYRLTGKGRPELVQSA